MAGTDNLLQFTVYNMDGFAYQVSFYTNSHGVAFNTYTLYLEDPSFNLVQKTKVNLEDNAV